MPYGLILLAVYVAIAIGFSLRVPIAVKKDGEDMRLASAPVSIVTGLLWPLVMILWVAALIKGSVPP
jgi:hypothetical protein